MEKYPEAASASDPPVNGLSALAGYPKGPSPLEKDKEPSQASSQNIAVQNGETYLEKQESNVGSRASTVKTAPRQQANAKQSSSMDLDAQKTSQTEEGAFLPKKSSEQLAATSKNSQTDDDRAQRQQRDSAMSQQSSK